MTNILHGCLDGIRTVPSNGKIMLIVKDMLGQEMPYSTHLPKSGYYSQFAFFVHMHIIVIIIVNRFFEQKFFLTETDYLMSEVECNFFAEPLLCT